MSGHPFRAQRRSGVLLHPTSLESPWGMGDLGPGARRFVQWLGRAGQQVWQVLPLSPVDGAGSPYASPSAFAGNPLLISVDDLIEQGLIDPLDSAVRRLRVACEEAGPGPVDHGLQHRLRLPVLRAAAARFVAGRRRRTFPLAAWLAFEEAAEPWLSPWLDFATARPDGAARDVEQALQFLFDQQMLRLREATRAAGVELVGDLPIFVSGDSADVTAHPSLFQLDAAGRPTVRAGCPPDGFAADGQLWGNPHYDWSASAATGHRWWRNRLTWLLRWVDRVRIDHFRGFAAAWAVPQGAETARDGVWVPGPGRALFHALADELGVPPDQLPLIAEDLGVITPDVEALRDDLGLPGMRILQFAFDGDPDHPFLPHNHPRNTVVYTGTHDNDTSLGWYESADDATRDRFRRYVARDGREPAWDLLRLAWSSPADLAVAPVQDVLGFGGDCRMNLPGTVEGNWSWRLRPGQLNDHAADRLAALTRLFGRHRRISNTEKVADPRPATD